MAQRGQPLLVPIEINPDRALPTPVQLTVRVADSRVKPVWRVPSNGRLREGVLRIDIPKEGRQTVELEVSAAEFQTDDRPRPVIQVDVQCADVAAIEGSRAVRIGLPREDIIRLVASPVGNLGFSQPIESGRVFDSGLVLKTLASRATPFELSLKNESGRPRAARLWLIRLENPFRDFQAYWPGLQIPDLELVGRNLRDVRGRVRAGTLGRLGLKGPIEMSLPATGQLQPIRWSKPPADGEAAEPAPTATTDAKPLDVSHGMAVVMRLLDASGNEMPEEDRILWIIPQPRFPIEYVQPSVVYQDSTVRLTAELLSDIDHDLRPDRIPELDTQKVSLVWHEDDQWRSHEPNIARTPRQLTSTLGYGDNGAPLVVPVVTSRGKTAVRLDVDGWPRAIHFVVDHDNERPGQLATQINAVSFRSVQILYPDRGSDAAAAPARSSTPNQFFFPDSVAFRGPGQWLQTALAADLNDTLLQPQRFANLQSRGEVRVRVNGQHLQRFLGSRQVTTSASAIADDGSFVLTSRVTDLQMQWEEGQREDERLEFEAELLVGNEIESSDELAVVLDATPPEVEFVEIVGGRQHTSDDHVKVSYRCVDRALQGQGGASGIQRVSFGIAT
ncbi:MAG: hypothetical protein AAGA03_19510, partial [Planctomycetota bacterium]